MTREEIDRHVAGIQALRRHKNRSRAQRRRFERGYHTVSDFNPLNRNELSVGVDHIFAERQRRGWLPRGGDE